MRNFEKITETPEALGTFLDSLTVIDSPWEDEFHKAICADCGQTDCAACPHEKERNNPKWWLMREADQETDAKAYREKSDGVCAAFSVYLGQKEDGGIMLDGVKSVAFPKVAAREILLTERAELVLTFQSMEYAAAVIRMLNKMCTIQIVAAVQHYNQIERQWDVHRNDYILEAMPVEIIAEPLTLFGGTGVEVHFWASRFSTNDGKGNERWCIEWPGMRADRAKETRG